TAAISMSVETKQPNYKQWKGTDQERKLLVPAYRAVFWFSAGATILGFLLACCTRMGKQGAKPKGDGELEMGTASRTSGSETDVTQSHEKESATVEKTLFTGEKAV